MKPYKADDFSKRLGNLEIGIRVHLYRWAIGIAGHYWPCLFAPHLTLHIGPLKFWVTLFLKNIKEN